MTLLALPVQTSVFRGTLGFFDKLGVYDVVLPFLLVFTLVFAIMEKTKIFGVEKSGEREYTRKNLNAMMAFVTAFFVIASTRLVAIISEVVANTVLLLLLSICFLLLVGSFHTGKEEFSLKNGWNKFFMFLMFFGIVIIFLNAMGWWDIIWFIVTNNFDSAAVSSIILLIVMVGFMVYITWEKKEKTEDKK